MDILCRDTLEIMTKARWYNQWLFSIISPYIKGEILEIGAGVGNFTEMLTKVGKVTLIDLEEEYITKINNKFGRLVSSGYGDIEKKEYFFVEKQFKTIVCLNVLEHIKNDKKAIQNMFNLLSDGGYLILVVPAHQYLYSNFDRRIGHFRRYSLGEVKSTLTKQGFKLKIVRYINWWAAIGWFVFIKTFKLEAMPKGPVGIFDKFGKLFLFPEKIVSMPFGLSVLAIAKK
jgi:SAM-dependent methyltransferase